MDSNNDYSNTRVQCRNCEYDIQPPGATNCVICGSSLPSAKNCKTKQQKISGLKSIFNKNDLLYRIKLEHIGLAIITAVGIGTFYTASLIGRNNFVSREDVPEGLFDYSSQTFIISAIYNRIEKEIEEEYPQFKLRYANSYNNVSSIQKLIDGELSFMYSDRPLSQLERDRADRRGYKFRQLPIGTKNTQTLYLIIRNDKTLEANAGLTYYELLNTETGHKIIKNAKITPAFIEK